MNKNITKEQQSIIDQAISIIKNSWKEAGVQFSSSSITKDLLLLELSAKEREVFAVAFLNIQHELIAFEEMFAGTIDKAAVYPREIAKRALELNSSAIILGHNHPSGASRPSMADEQITDAIRDAVSVLEIKVLDHIVVAREAFSFSEHGLI